MIPMIEFQNRNLDGPVMEAMEFDVAFSRKVRELVDKYEIKYEPEQPVCDDKTADAIFHAGVELLVDIGILNQDVNRVIKYTKEEIEAIAAEYRANPSKVEFGAGKDQMTIAYRTGHDTRPPTNYAGAPGVTPKEEFVAYVQATAQEPSVAGIGICPGLAEFDITPKAGTLSEVYVAKWEQEQLKEVLRRVDRPGLNLGLLCTASTPQAIFHLMRPGIREPYNTQVGVHVLPEQKIMWSQLLIADFCRDRGIHAWQSSMSMLGALCRNPQEVAVTLIANGLAQMSYAMGPTMSFFSNFMDGRYGWREPNWAVAAAMRASERNIKIGTGTAIGGTRWREESCFYQLAAEAVTYTAAGMAYNWCGGSTGLENRFVGEVCTAVAGMDRNQAGALAVKILNKFEEIWKANGYRNEEYHKPFAECYDLQTVKPLPEYEATYNRVKEDLASMGLPFK